MTDIPQQHDGNRLDSAATRDTLASSHFQQGDDYARFRPSYPDTLVHELTKQCGTTQVAVDVGCGTGQLTRLLAERFDRVMAIDNSRQQLSSADERSGIEYQHGVAEQLPVPDGIADLVVAAQAAHWFNLPKFYQQAERVCRPGAILALISYGVPTIHGAVNGIFQQGYWQDIYNFWPPQRRHVEQAYCALPFPFGRLAFPELEISQRLTFTDFSGYIGTWSAWRQADQQSQLPVFHAWLARMARLWPADQQRQVTWPIVVKAARLSD